MRMLDRNSKPVWRTAILDNVLAVDSDGNYTGEINDTYITPDKIKLALYPTDSSVITSQFGIVGNFDMIATTTNDVILDVDDLIFLSEPVAPYIDTYDYTVSKKAISLNFTTYGFLRKT